jgi:hypothetical protein
MLDQTISISRMQDTHRGHGRSSRGAKTTEKQLHVPKFEFITLNGRPDQVRTEYRKAVRVNAMRYFLQNKKNAASEEGDDSKREDSIPREIIPLKATTGRFKSESWSRKSRKPKSSHALSKTKSKLRRQDMSSMTIGKDLGLLMSLTIPSTTLTARLLDHCQYYALSRR